MPSRWPAWPLTWRRPTGPASSTRSRPSCSRPSGSSTPSANCAATLSDRTIPAARKAGLVDTIFGDKVAPATLALLRQAAAGRTGSFDAVLERFADEVAARRSRTLAEVRSAAALSDAELERSRAALSAKYGRTVHINTIVDPTIVGGLKVSIGDDVIDGTIVGRLEDARRQLAG